jgi:hypothetical protein
MTWTDVDAAQEREAQREFRRTFGHLAVDSRPEPIPTFEFGNMVPNAPNIAPDPGAKAEQDLIESFYAGVPWAIGKARHEQYLQERNSTLAIAREVRRQSHARR